MLEYLKLNLKIIFKSKFRFLTTIFGIMISIILFVITLSILNLERDKFYKSISKMGKNSFKINILSDEMRGVLSFEDIKALKDSNLYIKSISPELYFKGLIKSNYDEIASYVIGGSEDYKDFMGMDIIYGRFFTKDECALKENVIIIDNVTSMSLFGTENSLGREVLIKGGKVHRKYKVIGVMRYPSNIWKENKNIISFSVIPIDNYINNFGSNKSFEYLYVSINENENTNLISSSIVDFLKVKNGERKHSYKAEHFLKLDSEVTNINNGFILIFKLMIYVFFILSGINVIITMGFNIKDRQDEILLRRLSGSTKEEIFFKFLMEGVIICFISGVLGSLVSFIMVFLINHMFNVNLNFTFLHVLKFSFLSLILGIIYSVIPSFNASLTTFSYMIKDE